jgi:hypothetical protein
MYYFHYKSS